MELNQGYKQTELGAIPSVWDVKKIGEFATVTAGGTPSRENPAYWNGAIPWVTTTQIDFGTINQAHQFITELGLNNSAAKIFTPNTILMAMYGQGKTRGKVAILGIPAATNQACAAISVDKSIRSDFLFHFLASRYEQIRGESNSGGQENLSGQIVKSIRVPVPLPEEQKAIAAALSDVDLLLSALEQLIAKKRDIKKGAMQELLTGKRRLPGYSKDWALKSFDELFSFGGGYSASRADLSQNGHCYLHYGDIHTSSKTYVDLPTEASAIPRLDVALASVSKKSLLADGDVVFVDASEDDEGVSKHVVIHNPNEIPYISGLHTIVAKNRDESLTRGFKRFCFQTKFVKDQFRFFAVGTKVSGISKTNIAKIHMYVPPPEEQDAIAEILSDIENEIAALEAQREKTAALKQGMMQQLLTGKIRLT